jgi:L-threonylcarbamoyladenylate synthase
MFAERETLAVEPRESLPSPGVGLRHYAPRARLILVEAGDDEQNTDMTSRLHEEAVAYSKERVGVMLPYGLSGEESREELKGRFAGFAEVFWWGKWSEPEGLAQRLFAGLRQLDAAGCAVILCPLPTGGGIGDAIRDRLRKAAWKVE